MLSTKRHSTVLYCNISECIISDKNTQHQNLCMYQDLVLAEISACHLQLKCMGSHFFPGHP